MSFLVAIDHAGRKSKSADFLLSLQDKVRVSWREGKGSLGCHGTYLPKTPSRQKEQKNNTEMYTIPYDYSFLQQAVPFLRLLCLSTQVISVSLWLAIVQLTLLCYSCLSQCFRRLFVYVPCVSSVFLLSHLLSFFSLLPIRGPSSSDNHWAGKGRDPRQSSDACTLR